MNYVIVERIVFFTLLIISSYFLINALWDLRIGTNKKYYVKNTLIGVFVIILAYFISFLFKSSWMARFF